MNSEERERRNISEIGDGSIVSLFSLAGRKIIETLFSYVVTTLGGVVIYGFISILMRLEEITNGFSGGLWTGINRTLPRLSEKDKNTIISLVFLLSIVFWIIVGTTLFLSVDFVIENTILREGHQKVIYVFIISLLPFLVFPVTGTIFKSHKKIRLANLSWTLMRPLILLVGSAIALILFSSLLMTWVFITLFAFFGAILDIVLIYRYTNFEFVFPRFKSDIVVEFFDYIKYTTIARFFTLIQHRGSFILMSVFLAPINAGLFSLSFMLGNIIRWPLKSVNQIFPPIMTELYSQDDIEVLNRLYQRTSRVILFISLPAFVFASVYSIEILKIFSPQYTQNAIVFPILAFGQIIAVAVGSVGLMLGMTDNQRESMWLQIFLVIIYFPIVVYLTLEFGIIGLAIGASVSYILNNLLELALLWYLTQFYPFTVRHLYVVFSGFILFVTSLFLNQLEFFISSLPIFICLVAMYYYIVYKYVLQKNDKYMLRVTGKTIVKSLRS